MNYFFWALVYAIGIANGWWMGEMFCGRCRERRVAETRELLAKVAEHHRSERD